MRICKKCSAPLNSDEIGLYLKLVDRSATEFLCINCLGEHFKLPARDLLAMIERFRKTGCVLFAQKGDAEKGK